jgi:hypothetical protein
MLGFLRVVPDGESLDWGDQFKRMRSRNECFLTWLTWGEDSCVHLSSVSTIGCFIKDAMGAAAAAAAGFFLEFEVGCFCLEEDDNA